MKTKLLVVGLGSLAVVSALAEVKTWTWNGVTKHVSQPSWGADPNVADNWTDGDGNHGIPGRGDTVYLPKQGLQITSNNGATKNPWGDVYWTGSSAMQFFLCVETGHKLQINANYVGTSGLYLYGNGETEIESPNNADLGFQKAFLSKEGSPTLVKNGKWKLTCFYQAGNTRVYSIPYTKLRGGTLNICTSNPQSGLTFYFDGTNETAPQCFEYTLSGTYAYDLTLKNSAIIETNGISGSWHSISSKFGYQLVFSGTPLVDPMVFSGKFINSAGLNWSPDSAEKTFICSNGVSTTTGKMTATKGTLRLVDGASFTQLGEVVVKAGATFEVADVPSQAFYATQLTLDDATAKLKLSEGVRLTFNAAALAGAAMAPGVYSADGADGTRTAAWIEGAGTVEVKTGPANSDTWVGGDAGGDAMSLGGNWQKGTAPDFATGDLFATFAGGGTSATLTGVAKFDGIALKNTVGDSFSFAAGAGASAELGASGLTVADATAATTWTMGWPLVVSEDQSWVVGANNTLTLASGFSGDKALTLENAGKIVLAGTSTHSGTLAINTGSYDVTADNAFGASSRTVSFDHKVVRYTFSGTHVQSSPFYSKSYVDGEPSAAFMTFAENSDTTFDGKIQWVADAKMNVAKGAKVTFRKGLQSDNSAVHGYLYLVGSGSLVVKDVACSLAESIMVRSGSSVTTDLQVANCKIGHGAWCELYGGGLFTRVENSITDGQRLRLGSITWDLCGKNQRIGLLATSETGTKIKSDEPSVLTVNSSTSDTAQGGVNRVNNAEFVGKVSLVKDGSANHAIGATSLHEGSVTVKKGLLRMTSGGKWPNCDAVTVSGGTLELENAQAFGSNAVWSVASSASVVLDNAGTNACEKLYVDGKRKGGGVYGAVGSGAPREVSWITGTGFLQVAEHGLILFLQ